MTGWLRRNWIPTAGMAAAIAFVAWLGWINVRGGSGKGVGVPTATASVSPTSNSPSASASPVADPSVAEVERVAEAWLHAYFDSYRTADASVLVSMVQPDSQAAGEAGAPRTFVLNSHQTVVLTKLAIDPFTPVVVGDSATADIHFTTTGVPSSWPALKATGPPQTKQWSDHIGLIRVDGRWFIDSFV